MAAPQLNSCCFLVFLLLVLQSIPFAVETVEASTASRKLTATTAASSATLASCLANTRTAFPGTSQYESARTVFNLRYRYTPAAFVFPTTVPQVQNAVHCAVALGIGIAPRGGGHSYEDYSLGGRNNVLVVDMSGFNSITYDKTSRRATVGAGVRLGPLKLALWNLAKVTVPSGTCVTVGVAGHALGGGIGFTSRKFGLLADNLVEAQVVIANGTFVTVNANQHSDLYWALRGAGANSFGIVTQFTFTASDVSHPVTYFSYTFTKAQQAQTVNAFQIWGLTAVSEISASLYLDPSGGNQFYGVYLGPSSQFYGLVHTFFANAPSPATTTVLDTNYITTVLINGGFDKNANPSVLDLENYTYPTSIFKAKSIIVKNQGFSKAGITAFVDAVQAGQTDSYFIFDLFGASINKIPSSASAFVHRDALYSIQMFTYWQFNPAESNQDITFIDNVWSDVRPYASGEAYQNYIDRDMPLSAYYGSNLNRLVSVKNRWDARNIFNFPQSIPLKL